MAESSLRLFIDLVEGKPAPQQAWGVAVTPLFTETLKRQRMVFRDLDDRLKKFVDFKLENPLTNRYGKHDRPFTGPLIGFSHCHLRDNAILIYSLKNHTVNLIAVVSHSEIEGKRVKSILQQLIPYR